MKDTDYTFGTHDESAGQKDKRKQYRLTARAGITLELEADYPATEQEAGTSGRELVCEIRDISASGLSVLSRESLPEGALFPASASLENHTDAFVLTLEVVWCQPDRRGYLVGFRIVESAQTAYVEWIDAVAGAMEAP